ncbi:hypothetical protein [Comamonas jiangduensis]|uniref:Uncharacterized protein n=1 Tax=Comamonas jiangduensis TaxID=1194168 RepID=A0ABV4IC83_9BURK
MLGTSQTGNSQRDSDLKYLQDIVAGSINPLTVDFDRLIAFEKYENDKEIWDEFELASHVVADAALKATADIK